MGDPASTRSRRPPAAEASDFHRYPPPVTPEFAVSPQALALFESLKRKRLRLVLAESCTGGLAAGFLARIPGVSEVLCGSFVVYQTQIKSQWLGIAPQLLEDPKIGPVSGLVTERLAVAALERTPQASVAAAITGHLGPAASSGGIEVSAGAAERPVAETDGLIYIAVAWPAVPGGGAAAAVQTSSARLDAKSPADALDYAARYARQCEAVDRLFGELLRAIDEAH